MIAALGPLLVLLTAAGGDIAPSVATQPSTPACYDDAESLFALTADEFDQTFGGGWRVVAAREGCENAAAELIKTYIARNHARIELASLHAMYWHVGQLKAFAGEDREAVSYLMAGVNPAQRGRDLGLHEYATGTVAFLNRDRDGLAAARARLSELPPPDWYEAERAAGRMTAWPANLGVLDNLIRCFDAPYSVAYSNSC